jgi:predicted negative regulator of RcsB-dependent stress response
MRKFTITLLALAGLLLTHSRLSAIDVVVRPGDKRDGGKISKVSKTEVVLTKQVGGDTSIPVNEIEFIEWDGAPATMSLGRAALFGGQLDSAQNQLEQALQESSGSENSAMRADLDYLLARTLAGKAQVDATHLPAATEKLKAFLGSNRDHYQTFDAQLLLGDLSLSAGDFAAATQAFTTASTAPWKDYQMAAQVGQGRVLLAQNQLDAAKREFDAVAAVSPEGDAQKSRRLEGLLGQARCLRQQEQWPAAIKILDEVINLSSVANTRLQAEAYVLQGDCYVGSGANPKQAIMAYLHVDVIPSLSREADLHAEALFNLARLWKQVGGADERARDAADALREQYGESPWAKKLGG